MKTFILLAISCICIFANTSLDNNNMQKNTDVSITQYSEDMKDVIIKQILNQNEEDGVILINDYFISSNMINK